jgi:hypothetical protein
MLHRTLELAGRCEYGKETSVSIKRGEFFGKVECLVASQEELCSMDLINYI